MFLERLEFKSNSNYNAEFIVADTQSMETFPGNVYDLIHVDGQQDGDGSFHDLKLAIKQGKYVLVDGYFWTRKNFLAVSDFLLCNADLFDWYGVIPGYAGELLIKVSENYLSQAKKDKQPISSLTIRHAYRKNQGKKIEDPRLIAVANICSLKKSGRVLDLGCGRGELSYYFARQGFAVTSIDYSQSAIDLAQKCYEGDDSLKKNVEFICQDVCNVKLEHKYDLAVASDVIEHLAVEEVDKLYQKVANHLKSDGLFVLHTFPNLWYYKYEYSRRRKVAASVGAYLPPEPRSRYEQLMHINEQSPSVLKKQLSKYFKYVYLWFGSPENSGGSLIKKFSIKEMSQAPSLFAVVSQKQIDYKQLQNTLQMSPLPALEPREINIIVRNCPSKVNANIQFEIELYIENNSQFILNSCGNTPVNIAYHWMNKGANEYIVFDGKRTKLMPALYAHNKMFTKPFYNFNKRLYRASVQAPPNSGDYILRLTLVQEHVRWFDTAPTQLYQDIAIAVMN
jgi:2-polyprenyl-3-methyl-5-hydroxy-6-metoxy-1,4-benzoquinol methylase